jgi:hypothetical protein
MQHPKVKIITQKLIQRVLNKRIMYSKRTEVGLTLRRMSTSVHMQLQKVSLSCAGICSTDELCADHKGGGNSKENEGEPVRSFTEEHTIVNSFF